MNHTDERGQAPSVAAADSRERPGVDRRRLLLGGAGSGLALATSGLFLPERLVEEVAADKHPVRKIQERRDRRRQKARNAKHSSRKRNKKDPGSSFAIIDGIRWGFYSDAGPFDVQLWARVSAGRAWGILESRYIPVDNFVELRTLDTFGILWINNRYYLRAQNWLGALRLSMGYGGIFTSNHGWEGGTAVLTDYSLPERHLAPDMVVDGFKFTVERIPDDDDYKKPSLTIRRA